MYEPPLDAKCDKCGALPYDKCVTTLYKETAPHAIRKRRSRAMRIDSEQGRTAARRYMPTY